MAFSPYNAIMFLYMRLQSSRTIHVLTYNCEPSEWHHTVYGRSHLSVTQYVQFWDTYRGA